MTTPQSPGAGNGRGLGWISKRPSLEPGRASPGGRIRTSRVHRNLALDRSGDGNLCDFAYQPGPSRRQRRREGAQGAGQSGSLRSPRTALGDTDPCQTARASHYFEKIDHGTSRRQRERVATGVDILKEERFSLLKGKRIGLITNHTGLDSEGTRTLDLLRKAKGQASPRSSARARPVRKCRRKDCLAPGSGNGPPVTSLYGDHRRPTPKMFAGSTQSSLISGCGGPLLHLYHHHGVCDGGRGRDAHSFLCP